MLRNDENVKKYLKYCDNIVKKICRDKIIYGDIKEELLSVGRVGLAVALENYDADKGASIETHIYNNVINEIKIYFRKIIGENPEGKRRAAFDALNIRYIDNVNVYYHDTNKINKKSIGRISYNNNIDIFCNNSNNINKSIEYKDLIRKIFSQLPEHYTKIILLHDAEGFTFAEIGKQLDYTTSNVHSLYHRAVSKFKKIYKEL